ncbi:unnamed protein product, partial [Mesorhabditis spiculigera]
MIPIKSSCPIAKPTTIMSAEQSHRKNASVELIQFEGQQHALWGCGRMIVLSLPDGSPIFQCFFNGDGADSSKRGLICAVGQAQVELFDRESVYFVNLPFELARAFPSSLGLLLERKPDSDENLDGSEPILFSLCAPYGEISAVVMSKKGFPTECYHAFPQERMHVAGTSSDHLVSFDEDTGLHSFFTIVPFDASNKSMEILAERRMPMALHSKRFSFTPNRLSHCSPAIGYKTPAMERLARTGVGLLNVLHSNRPTPKMATCSPANSSYNVADPLRDRNVSMGSEKWSSWLSTVSDFDTTAIEPPAWDECCVEISLRQIFVESPKNKSAGKTSKVLRFSDVARREFVGMVVPSANADHKEFRVYDLSVENDAERVPVEVIPCLDVVQLSEPGYYLLLDPMDNLQLYSGTKKICLVAICDEAINSLDPLPASGSPREGRTRIGYGKNGFLLIKEMEGGLSNCRFLPLPRCFSHPLSDMIWKTLLAIVPKEKTFQLASDCRYSFSPDSVASSEIEQLFIVLARHMGISFEGNHWISGRQSPSAASLGEEVPAKIPRPPQTTEDIAAWALAFKDEAGPSISKPSLTFHAKNDSFLHNDISTILARIHVLYETKRLFNDENGMATFTEALFLLNRAHGHARRAQIYLEDMPELAELRVLDKSEDIETRMDVDQQVFYLPDLIARVINKELTTLPSRVSLEIATYLMSLSIGLGHIRSLNEAKQFLGNTRRLFSTFVKSQDNLIDLTFANDRLLPGEKCALFLDKFSPILEFAKLAPDARFLLEFVMNGQHLAKHTFYLIENQLKDPSIGHLNAEDLWKLARLRWPHDIRLHNVKEMLDNSRATFIPKREGLNDTEIKDQNDQFMVTVAIRTMTLAFGNAGLKLRSVNSSANRWFEIQDICFAGRVYPENRPFELSVNDTVRPIKDWGDFYNGVSIGLSIVFSENNKITGNAAGNDRNMARHSPASSGLLLGLGLNNHLPVLNIYNAHQLLAATDKLTSIALLLGYGASRLGTADEQVHKIIITHISFLMGPTLLEVNIETSIQTAAIVSLGLLFAQRGTGTLINQLVNEIGRPMQAETEPANERYAYGLALGFAIGLAGLGRGEMFIPKSPISEQKPGLIERFVVMMEGGPRSRAVFNSDLISEHTGPFDEPQAPLQSSHCREIPARLNSHQTAHPATIALGLLFFKTGNKQVDHVLTLPDTIPALEKIRADIIPVRVLARALVMWDTVEATKEWIIEQVPIDVRNAADKAIGMDRLNKIFSSDEEEYWDVLYDRETVAQTYIHCISAACFAISLKYASTHDPRIKALFIEYLMMLLPDDTRIPAHSRLVRLADKGAVAVSMNLLISAIGILMAGSGDVEVMKICHFIRRADAVGNWLKNLYTHSVQGAVQTTLGLLFMGNARYALSRSDIAIASMVIAFYPTAAHHAGDNRLYLQAFRFLWVLAVERRLIYTVDLKDRSNIFRSPIMVQLNDGTRITSMTPQLLPDVDTIDFLEIGGGTHLKIRIERNQIEELLKQNGGCVALPRAKTAEVNTSTINLNEMDTKRVERAELKFKDKWRVDLEMAIKRNQAKISAHPMDGMHFDDEFSKQHLIFLRDLFGNQRGRRARIVQTLAGDEDFVDYPGFSQLQKYLRSLQINTCIDPSASGKRDGASAEARSQPAGLFRWTNIRQ